MQAPRQTLTYLKNLFGRRGIAPRHQYGQNFLIDLNLHDLIARTAELGPNDVVLEVGPGTGALTSRMAKEAGFVVSIDIDPRMAELAREATAEQPNVRVFLADALASKHRMNADLMATLAELLAEDPERQLKLVANLPYNIATPLISNLLLRGDLKLVRMVVTIQLELAERLTAAAHSSHYGALSVLVQSLADVEIVRTLAPSVFWPKPKVQSAIVQIIPNAEKRAAIADLTWFHSVVHRIFQHRRKNLRGVLYTLWKDRWSKPEVDALLESLGLLGDIRAEAMDVPEFLSLADALRARFGEEAAAGAENVDDTPEPEIAEE